MTGDGALREHRSLSHPFDTYRHRMYTKQAHIISKEVLFLSC